MAPHSGFVWMDTAEVAGVSGQVGTPLVAQPTTVPEQHQHPSHEPALLSDATLLVAIAYVVFVGLARRGIKVLSERLSLQKLSLHPPKARCQAKTEWATIRLRPAGIPCIGS